MKPGDVQDVTPCTPMKNRIPYLFLLAGTLGMALYPRMLSASAPPILRSDGVVGFVYGICIGLEVLAVMMAANAIRCRVRTTRS